MFDFLGAKIRASLGNINNNFLNEVRLRSSRPVMIEYRLKKMYLAPCGAIEKREGAIEVTENELKETVLALCERSVYAYTDKIRNGFITTGEGVRVGVCGECVVEGEKIVNVKNVSSINIRIPHAVRGCAEKIAERFGERPLSALVVSPVGAGKTTFIRDLADSLSEKFLYNVLVCDERNEIFPLMSRADTVDCITYSPKIYAFENGIRSMAPEIIVTDEISSEADVAAILGAKRRGVEVIATAHGTDAAEIFNYKEFRELKGIFDILITLDESLGKGTVKSVTEAEKTTWAG